MQTIKRVQQKEVPFSKLFEELTRLRVCEPERVVQVAQKRKRRKRLTDDGNLNILAADHPARRVIKAGNNAFAMADRQDFLTRIVRILSANAVDGVMTTMDVLEELLLLHDLMLSNDMPGFLDGKLMLVSLNRGGLNGVSWEMDDPMTGASPETTESMCMDGVKLLWRLCDDNNGSLETMNYCISAINEASKLKLPIFFEPLPVVREGGSYKLVKTAEALIPLIGAATALGDTSRYLWLKLPYCSDFARVAKSTTLPIVMLGGESGDTQQFLSDMKEGMTSQHNVRGTMIGRNVMYPSDDDPVTVAMAVQEIVHGGRNSSRAVAGESLR